jgi:molecular chaperone GrpE
MNDEPTSLEEKWAREASESAGTRAEEATPELEARVAELTDALLRQQAEMANYRRRVERDREEHTADARRDLLRGLIPVIDDFERALEAQTDNFEAYRAGVELILRSLHEFLSGAGVESIDPHGHPFDPHLHEAVEHSSTDEVPEHHVAIVHQKGYLHGGRLLRPARVGVARPAQAGPDAASDSEADGS